MTDYEIQPHSNSFNAETGIRYRIEMPIDGYRDYSSEHPSGCVIRTISYPERDVAKRELRNLLIGATIMAGREIDFEELDGNVLVHIPPALRQSARDSAVEEGEHTYSDAELFKDIGKVLSWLTQSDPPLYIREDFSLANAFAVTDFEGQHGEHLYLPPGLEYFIDEGNYPIDRYERRMKEAFAERFADNITDFRNGYVTGLTVEENGTPTT